MRRSAAAPDIRSRGAGPAEAPTLRLWGDRVEEIRPKVRDALLEGMADFERADGVYATSSTWAVSAVAP